MKKHKVYIGTSGWSYQHWKENFYPKGLASKKWLEFYSRNFQTVEINTTFYHLPLETTIKGWYEQSPKDFLFSVKASRYITHRKRLHDCEESLALFFNRIKGLKSKLGPILIQLSPSFKMNKERLIEFVSYLTDDYQYVFEFRHPSWFVDEIYQILAKKKIALCITDLNGKLSPEVITGDFTYIRLHGPKKAYQGTYGIKNLKLWQDKILEWSKKVAVFCYFDNDEKGYAIQDSMTLKNLIKGENMPVRKKNNRKDEPRSKQDSRVVPRKDETSPVRIKEGIAGPSEGNKKRVTALATAGKKKRPK